jgi:glycosyltransferase involved in cell wall biosynthesis
MPLDGGGDREEIYRRHEQSERLTVFQVMPREMYFGASLATSIDLCVRDLVSFSRFRATTRIFAEARDDCFSGFTVDPLPPPKRAATFRRANHIAKIARHERPDIIVVQQHLPTAAAIAIRLPRTKVVLFAHNFQKSYQSGNPVLSALRRRARGLRYARLAGIIHVSETCRQDFAENWPSVSVPGCVVTNGLDFSAWNPARERLREVLCIGRCAPEKGILEAAEALAAVLPKYPAWRARFVLSAIDAHPDYFRNVRGALAGLGEQAIVQIQRPFDEIKAASERAAIALVPSKCRESFGRTALEAHAGGAALISSGNGGLTEISGRAALHLPEVTQGEIAAAVETLIGNEELRASLAQDGANRVRALFDVRTQAAWLDGFCRTIACSASHPARINGSGDRAFSVMERI